MAKESPNPFQMSQVEQEQKPEKPKNLVTYRKSKEGEVTVDLNNLTSEDLQVLADSILEHESDSLLGMQAKLHNAIVEEKNAKGDRKRELDEYVAKAKKELEEEVGKLGLGKDTKIIIKNSELGFINEVFLIKGAETRLQNILPQIASFLILNIGLILTSRTLDYGDISALADSPNLRQLTSLDLSYNRLGPEVARALADSPNIRQLTRLCLDEEDIGPEGARALAETRNFPNLKRLNLTDCELYNSDDPNVLAGINALKARGVEMIYYF